MSNRKESDYSPSANYVKNYLRVLPKDDMSQIIYWDQKTLNQIDSELLRNIYRDTTGMYHYYHKLLVEQEDSPYRTFSENKQAQVSIDEFLWAFTTVGARHLILNNEPY